MPTFRNGVIASLTIHAILLVGMSLYKFANDNAIPKIPIESIIAPERVQEDFRREIEQETEAATSLNFTAGGAVTNVQNPNASGSTSTQNLTEAIDDSPLLEKPKIDVRISPKAPPRDIGITASVGDQAVTGETGAVVDGYGAALGQLTRELVGVMREHRVLVVWMLDESHSMKDDREDIAANIDKVFDELGIATQSDKRLRRGKEILTQAVLTYGRTTHDRLNPTADIEKVREAIKVTDDSQLDTTGDENMCTAIQYVCAKYGKLARVQKRKCLVILVSDESGDDGKQVEKALVSAQDAEARIYVLGRESVFGSRISRMRIKDPDPQFPGRYHWLPMNRGPETAYVEGLQWNGMRRRDDNFRAYFGPYEMVRLAKETGGVFFVLPGEEEQLAGPGANDKRKFDFLDMKQYEPELKSRREYEDSVQGSTFRTGIFRVILALDPDHPTNPLVEGNPPKPKDVLDVYRWAYPFEVEAFKRTAEGDVQKAIYVMKTLNLAIAHLEALEPERAGEASPRWRANYDLIYAQCLNYKMRMFQSILAMEEHGNNMPKAKDEKTNRWHFHRSQRIIRPDEAQYERLSKSFGLTMTRDEFLAEMDRMIALARSRFRSVIEDHPGTPWARTAEAELGWGFGMAFREHYHNPMWTPGNPNAPKRKVPLPKL